MIESIKISIDIFRERVYRAFLRARLKYLYPHAKFCPSARALNFSFPNHSFGLENPAFRPFVYNLLVLPVLRRVLPGFHLPLLRRHQIFMSLLTVGSYSILGIVNFSVIPNFPWYIS
jgi:hypothetical protein